MPELLLGPMLRHVTETSATIWVETDQRCTVEILGRTTPTFAVADHHYALSIIEDLEPGSTVEYDVRLNGEVRWPTPGSTLPPSRIQTHADAMSARIVFGSCRTAAPHEEPWTLELALDSKGRGVDALYAYAVWMLGQPVDEWPELAVMLGDQIYADDSSPKARERIAEAREAKKYEVSADLPPELVGGFEEYTWLYQEAWSPEIERWFFSNVPSVMIFDDHEMIDDWNISDAWVRNIRTTDWWQDHVVGGLMTYWLYQHLGNLSPAAIRSEGLLAALADADDGADILRAWAMRSEKFTNGDEEYSFSFIRDLGRVRLVMVDSRKARVLDPGERRMVDDEEWQWVVDACNADVDHLLIGTSLPVFVPGGLHDLEVWSEAICDGSWGRPGRKFGEWLRVTADMEDWSAFLGSFDAFHEMLAEVAGTSRGVAPSTVSVLSGDIHFSYAAELRFPGKQIASKVHQLVSSPIRNALTGPENVAMRLGTSRFTRQVGRLLRWCVRRPKAPVVWSVDVGPMFGNSLGEISFKARAAQLCFMKSRPGDGDDGRPQFDKVIDCDLVAGASTHK